jgi:predicted metal-dependent phosphoesterase TrpH
VDPSAARTSPAHSSKPATWQAFDHYLARSSPAYVERAKLEPADAIRMITDARGLAVFAHPPFTDDHERVAETLAAEGLFGMEVYYRAYPPEQVELLRALAERLGLFGLGGSDYHNLDRPDEREPGDIPLPDEVVEAFIAAAFERGCAVPA